jgi:cyclin B
MWIASKYEEMYAPEVRDFVFITDDTYSSEEIKTMECRMLRVLDYNFGNPLCLHFLRRYSRAGEVSWKLMPMLLPPLYFSQATPEVHTMAKFLLELCLPDYQMLAFTPSLCAASALYLSKMVHKCGGWVSDAMLNGFHVQYAPLIVVVARF